MHAMRTHVFAADTENELAQLPAVLPLAHSPEFARPPAGVARPVLVNGGSSGSVGTALILTCHFAPGRTQACLSMPSTTRCAPA